MTQSSDPIDLFEPESGSEMTWLIAMMVILILVVVGIFAWRAHQADAEHQAMQASMNKELNDQRAAMDAQKEKVVQMSQQLEALKRQVDQAQGDKRRALVNQYNALAREQNTERDKWQAMAATYNERIMEFSSTGR